MTPQKCREAVEEYRRYFMENNIGKIDYPHDEILHEPIFGLEHCHGMLDRMLEFVNTGRMDKFFRWLGFIQGVLWAAGVYPLTELKNHNRPEE